MEKKQTAVECLEEQLNPDLKTMQGNIVQGIIEQAKEIEKEQIMDAHYEGQCDNTEGYPKYIAEQYYNKTYGNG